MSNYGQTPPPPGGYGGAPMGGGQTEHPKGTTILVLGILSLVCCSPLGIAAWVMGNNALAEIDAHPGGYSNRGVVQAGRICGIIGVVFMILGIVWLLFLGGLGVMSSNA